MPTVHDHAHALADRTVATRRDLHAHPQIAFQETRTMGVIAERLRALGLEPRTGVGGTGVVAMWDTGTPGRTVLLRADMDALPVPDEKSVPYRSTREGWNHACGHDGHVAVLLSVAEVLTAQTDLAGRVVFVFQPAEEVVRGAEAMLADGALEGLTPDASVGLHLSSMHPTGTVAVREGPAMAAADSFRLTVHGRGGHAAKPNETVDPVVVSAHLVLALQALVSRETDPVDQSVISVTSVHGGTAFNIIGRAQGDAAHLRRRHPRAPQAPHPRRRRRRGRHVPRDRDVRLDRRLPGGRERRRRDRPAACGRRARGRRGPGGAQPPDHGRRRHGALAGARARLLLLRRRSGR